jgi:hypothetical protein
MFSWCSHIGQVSRQLLFFSQKHFSFFLQIPFLNHPLLTCCGFGGSDQFKTDCQENMIPGILVAIILCIYILEFSFNDTCQPERWVGFTGTKEFKVRIYFTCSNSARVSLGALKLFVLTKSLDRFLAGLDSLKESKFLFLVQEVNQNSLIIQVGRGYCGSTKELQQDVGKIFGRG